MIIDNRILIIIEILLIIIKYILNEIKLYQIILD